MKMNVDEMISPMMCEAVFLNVRIMGARECVVSRASRVRYLILVVTITWGGMRSNKMVAVEQEDQAVLDVDGEHGELCHTE
jgi:hypothetical protein